MSEQLALDQPGGQRGAVHLDERTVLAPARRVDRAGDELLAGSGLAEDQYRAVRIGDEPDLLEDGHQRGALADELVDVVNGADLLLEVLADPHRLLGSLVGGEVERGYPPSRHPPFAVAYGVDRDADPQRSAVGPPALELLPANLFAGKEAVAHRESDRLAVQGVGSEVVEPSAEDLLAGVTEHLHHRAVRAVDFGFARRIPVCDRRLVVEIAVERRVLDENDLGSLALGDVDESGARGLDPSFGVAQHAKRNAHPK